MGDTLAIVFSIAFFVGFAGIILSLSFRPVIRMSQLRKMGYEEIVRGYNYFIWFKDDEIYYIPGNNIKKAAPIEITGLSEITRNARLVQLEIRYRINGNIKSMRLNGSTNRLLTIADKLGYGG